jgi:LmbE family N-acetylglucosaminyl deacetylase
MSILVGKISEIFPDFQPDEVLLPYPGDVHSDHRVTFEAASACTKWFRYPSVKRVLAYETPSETDFGIDPRDSGFKPNVFVYIGG